MNTLKVRIERLEPMRMARFHAMSAQPEQAVWTQLKNWIEPQGWWGDLARHPIFGFNHPSPTPGKKEYGYELWIQVDAEGQYALEIEIFGFPGGRYAVTTCAGFPNPQIWRQLWDWVQANGYQWRKTNELERIHDPNTTEAEIAFDLYLPIMD